MIYHNRLDIVATSFFLRQSTRSKADENALLFVKPCKRFASAEVVKLTDEIAALNAEIDSKKADMASATEEREKEKVRHMVG